MLDIIYLSTSKCLEISFALTATGKFNVGTLYHAPEYENESEM